MAWGRNEEAHSYNEHASCHGERGLGISTSFIHTTRVEPRKERGMRNYLKNKTAELSTFLVIRGSTIPMFCSSLRQRKDWAPVVPALSRTTGSGWTGESKSKQDLDIQKPKLMPIARQRPLWMAMTFPSHWHRTASTLIGSLGSCCSHLKRLQRQQPKQESNGFPCSTAERM
ncbi:hypothetical protein HDV62DRAFT_8156 [Trichoderma sp. SZMC 28011]